MYTVIYAGGVVVDGRAVAALCDHEARRIVVNRRASVVEQLKAVAECGAMVERFRRGGVADHASRLDGAQPPP